MNKKFKFLLYSSALLLMVFVLIGCQKSESDETAENPSVVDEDENENGDLEEDTSASTTDTENAEDEMSSSDSSNEPENDESNKDSLESEDESTDKDVDLSKYSSEEIEYARIWHQLGPNPDIDKLYVIEKSAGTPLNPKHEDVSAVYPEDVIMLKGTRIVDGAVTYSGNGDGTINVYKVPVRWNERLDGEDNKDEIKESTERIAKETEKVEIEAFTNEKIIEYIEKIELD
ncbi:hypothetical protein [Oceanobacillus massiliensis]|uniref:hypothetical protein n=1 Tax=Oceanobacillus massiliensis TaxID=1465765 RepID=UPI000288D4DF|nr:hypothetical protein [Oceanobacillus massiliensis]